MGLKIAEFTKPTVRILLIDDDFDQHNLITLSLRSEFLLTCEAAGANAVGIALEVKPDLILLDLQMPHIDGFEVLEQLKRHPSLAALPVFCLSASTDEQTRARCTQAGAAGFFKKPIDIKTFSHDVKKTFENLSNILYSDDKKSSVYVGLNDLEIGRHFQALVQQSRSAQKKVVALSIRDGVFYADEEIKKLVDSFAVIYLQIKPSLITRLPFIDDLNIVMSDLRKLLDDPTENCSVIIDRPELLLLSPSNDNKTATILAFSEAMIKNFSEVHYLCRKPATSYELPAITEMSRLLARQF